MIKRKINQDLADWNTSSQRKPLILKGTRQVGKTSSIRQFGRENFQHIHYLNFEKDSSLIEIFNESIDPRVILNRLSQKLSSPIDNKSDLIVFDEVQLCPRALTSLKYFCEELREVAIIAAGSLLGITLAGLTDVNISFPVGKVNFLEMFPLTFQEFLDAGSNQILSERYKDLKIGDRVDQITHQMLWQAWTEYITIGGLPEVVSMFYEKKNSIDQYSLLLGARRLQEDILRSYEADVAKHSGRVNALHIIRVLNSVPNKIQALNDGSTRKFTFKDVVPGISGYQRLSDAIDWLKEAGLVYKLDIVNNAEQPLSAFSDDSVFKLFLFDLGIMGAISALDPLTYNGFDFGTFKGYVAEHFVLHEMIKNRMPPGACWKSQQSEVEFIMNIQGELIPIEVKSSHRTKAKSLGVYISKYKPKRVVVFSANAGGTSKSGTTERLDAPIYMAGKLGVLGKQLTY